MVVPAIFGCSSAQSCLSLLVFFFIFILFLLLHFLPNFYLTGSLLLPIFLIISPLGGPPLPLSISSTTSFFSFKSLVVISELVSTAVSDTVGHTSDSMQQTEKKAPVWRLAIKLPEPMSAEETYKPCGCSEQGASLRENEKMAFQSS